MRRRLAHIGAAITLIAGVFATITPTGAQTPEFTISPTSGTAGTTVTGNVDPALIDERCFLPSDPDDVDAVQADFVTLFTQYQPYLAGYGGAPVDSLEEAAANSFNVALLGIAGFLGDENTIEYIANTHVLTFIDLATTEPIGDRSTFDPDTGIGQVTVPDVAPGLYGVAATCVEPLLTDESIAEALVAGADALAVAYGDLAGALGADPIDAARLMAENMLPAMMVPMGDARWVQQFTIPAPAAEPDPDTVAFCGVLPELSPLGDELLAALAELPEDDGEMTLEEWAALTDWEAVGAELQALVEEIEALLATGDPARPDALAPQWEIATASLRQLRDALRAVDFDLSGEAGRTIAGQLRAAATGDGSDPEVDAAIGALTDWFLANCVTDAGETPRSAPAAAPVQAQPTFTG